MQGDPKVIDYLNKGLRSLNVLSIVADPESPATMYAGTAAAIYKSADRGRSWTEIKGELYVTAMAIDPRSPSTLYAATQLGVIKSETAGQQWKPLRMAPLPAEALAAPPAGRRTAKAGGGEDAMTSESLPALPLKSRAAPRPPALPPLPVRTPGRA